MASQNAVQTTLITEASTALCFTAIEDGVININILNSGDKEFICSLYIGNQVDPTNQYLIEVNQTINPQGVILRCGEPVLKDENVHVKLEAVSGSVEPIQATVRVSGILDKPIVTV